MKLQCSIEPIPISRDSETLYIVYSGAVLRNHQYVITLIGASETLTTDTNLKTIRSMKHVIDCPNKWHILQWQAF